MALSATRSRTVETLAARAKITARGLMAQPEAAESPLVAAFRGGLLRSLKRKAELVGRGQFDGSPRRQGFGEAGPRQGVVLERVPLGGP